MNDSEVTKVVQKDYESELEDALMDLREQQHADLELMKEKLEQNYNEKVTKLVEQLDVARRSSMKGHEAEKMLECKVERLQATITTMQKQVVGCGKSLFQVCCISAICSSSALLLNLTNRVV